MIHLGNLHEVIHSLVVFREKDTRNALFIFSIYSFIAIGFDDLYSLWTATPRYQGAMIYSQKQMLSDFSKSGSWLSFTTLECLLGIANKLEKYRLSSAICLLTCLSRQCSGG